VPYEGAADLVHDTAATLNLATCTTPNGAACELAGVRPNNTVICPIINRDSTLTFITLGGGGLFVADTRAEATVPPIVAEYDNVTVHPHGCGGMQSRIEAAGRIYINSGAGGTHPSLADLYSFPLSDFPLAPAFNPPNTPVPTVVFSLDTPGHDSHGMLLNEKSNGRYLWVNDRAANTVEVVDTRDDTHIDTFSLVNQHSADPAPDLMDIAPDGTHGFLSLRGRCPLTANVASVNNAVGATPGVGVVQVLKGGRRGKLIGVAPISNPAPAVFNCASRTDDDGAPFITEQADAHGIAVRGQ